MRKKISAFARLFIHNNEAYPATLDGQVIPWLSISRSNKKSPMKRRYAGQNWKPVSKAASLKVSPQKQTDRKTLKLSSLDTQLKKIRLLVILKNGIPLKKTKRAGIKKAIVTGKPSK